MSDQHDFFPGFSSGYFATEQGQVFARHGGEGSPVLLLHGFPQTHICWHRVAGQLAKNHHVVLMDLRGYGWSSAPRGDGGRETYSKRAMGRDAVKVMSDLGYTRFALVGHDRGARVGYRLALDHPGRLTHLGLIDILPTIRVWERIESGAIPGAHWEFLSRPEPEPEEAITKDATAFFEKLMSSWTHDGTLDALDRRALKAYRQASNDPARIHAFCEDYRGRRHHGSRTGRGGSGRGQDYSGKDLRDLGGVLISRAATSPDRQRRSMCGATVSPACGGRRHQFRAFPRRGEPVRHARDP